MKASAVFIALIIFIFVDLSTFAFASVDNGTSSDTVITGPETIINEGDESMLKRFVEFQTGVGSSYQRSQLTKILQMNHSIVWPTMTRSRIRPTRKCFCGPVLDSPSSTFRINPLFQGFSTNTVCHVTPPPVNASIEIQDGYDINDLLQSEYTIKNFTEPGKCTVIIFYSSKCHMSAKAAPQFNAIPRLFGHIRFVAVDVLSYPKLINTFVIYGLPAIMVFHDGKLFVRYSNHAFDISSISSFLENHTDQRRSNSSLEPRDYIGPLFSDYHRDSVETQVKVVLAWLFIMFSTLYGLSRKPMIDLYLKICWNFQTIQADLEFGDFKGGRQ